MSQPIVVMRMMRAAMALARILSISAPFWRDVSAELSSGEDLVVFEDADDVVVV